MNIIMASSEMTPFAKTGGLGDVLGALPYALAARGHEITVIIPFYRCIENRSEESVLEDVVMMGDHPARFKVIRLTHGRGVTVYAIHKEEYFDRSQLYGTAEGDYQDNAERFIFFSKAVLQTIRSMGWSASILHAHDWQAGLIPLYVKSQKTDGLFKGLSTVFTIHNLAYQGIFSSHEFRHTNLSSEYFSMQGMEFYGRMNLMKGGIVFSDTVTTVSQTYAQEIQTPEYGFGLDGVLRSRMNAIHGISNGVDDKIWNPETDPFITEKFGVKNLEKKHKCKIALLREAGLENAPQKPLFGLVSRFAGQKGMDLLIDSFPQMLEHDALFIILGSGEDKYEKAFKQFAAQYPHRISLTIGFDEALAHRIYAGSDFFLMPSLYEPCGLSQLYAMRYGCIPLVRKTGGLADTVKPWNPKTREGYGFQFSDPRTSAWMEIFVKAMETYPNSKAMAAIQKNAMKEDFSWNHSAKAYETLYQSLQS